MPNWYVNTFGWGMVISLIVLALILTLIPWPQESALYREHSENEYALDETDVVHGKHAATDESGQEIRS